MADLTARLSVEEQNGKCDFEYHTCSSDEDIINSYLRMRFIQEHKGIRYIPKEVKVEQYIKVTRDEDHQITPGELPTVNNILREHSS
jgi:hypothetical protein